MSAPMPLWQQFLQRLGQHAESVVAPVNPLNGSVPGTDPVGIAERALLGGYNATVGTLLGLPLEAGRYVGTTGAALVPDIAALTPLHNLLSPQAQAQLGQLVQAGRARQAQEFAANGPNVLADLGDAIQNTHDFGQAAQGVASTPLAWATGAAALGLDPSNYIGGLLKLGRGTPVIGRALAIPDFALNTAPEAVAGAAGKALAALAGKAAPEAATAAESAAAPAASDALQAVEKAVTTPATSEAPSAAQEALQALSGPSGEGATQAAMSPAEQFLRQTYGDAYDHEAARALNVDFTGSPDTFAIRPELQDQYRQFLAGLDQTPPAASPASGMVNLGVEAANLRKAAPSELAQLAQAAYGQKAPFLLQQLTGGTASDIAAALRGEAPLTVGGQDITSPLTDYLRGRGTPQAADLKAALKSAIQGAAPAAESALAPLAEEAAPAAQQAAELVAGKLGAIPSDNYLKPLSTYTDRLYRDTSIGDAMPYLDRLSSDSTPRDIYMANAPDLALGQKGNTGVMLELDPAQIEGKVNTAKPIWPAAWQAGQAEFIARNAVPDSLRDAVQSVTVDAKALSTPGEAKRLRLVLGRLEGQGWQRVALPDGAVRLIRPGAQQAAQAAEEAGGPNSAALLARYPELAGNPFYDPAAAQAQGKSWWKNLEKWAADTLQSGVSPTLGLAVQHIPEAGKATAATTALGALGGFALPANDVQDRLTHAGEGATAGLGAGLGIDNSTLGSIAKAGFAQGVEDQKAAFATGQRVGLKDLGGLWKSNVTATVKNLIQELTFNKLMAAHAGYGPVSPYLDEVAQQVAQHSDSLMPASTQAALAATGQEGRQLALGTDFMANDERYKNIYHPIQTALFGAGMSGANAGVAAMPLAGIGLGAARGFFRPLVNRTFVTLIDAIQSAFRHGAFTEEYTGALKNTAPAFLQKLADAGVDVSSLAAKDGLFHPDEVAALAGPEAGQAWQQVTDNAVAQSEDAVRKAFLDFSSTAQRGEAAQQRLGISAADWKNLSKAEQAQKMVEAGLPQTLAGKIESSGVGTLVPFIGWALRAYPKTVELALNHPAVALSLFHLYQADQAAAYQSGKPLYAVGSLPISSEFPIIGKLVDMLTGGRGGTAYVNPLQMFSPAQPNALNAGMQFAADTNAYEKASDILSLGGFQFNPIIQDAAYALGQSAEPAMPFSRTSEIEEALAPGGYQKPGSLAMIPSYLNQGLRMVRSLATGENVPPPDDPAMRMAEDMAMRQTGLPLGDPRNLPLAHAYNDKTSPQYAQAKQASDVQLLAKGILGLISPATLSPQTTQQRATAQAKAQIEPFAPWVVAQAMQQDPNLALAMQRANQYAIDRALHGPDRSLANQALAYESPGVAGDERLYQFARQYAYLQAVAPTLYKSLLAAYAQKIGASPDGGGGGPAATGKAQP